MFCAHFWSIFPIFGAFKFFPENPALSRTTLYGFLAPWKNLEENNQQQQQRHFILRYQIFISNYGCALKFSIKDSMFSKVIAIFYLKRRYFHTQNNFVYLCLFIFVYFSHFSVYFLLCLCWVRFDLLSFIFFLYGMGSLESLTFT